MEFVDIVDENLKVLYQISKQQAHDHGLLHPTIIAEVINSRGEWLLVKQADDRQDPGQFVSPIGGHISAGESKVNALKREALEETGLKNFPFKYIGKGIYQRKWKVGVENHYFLVYEIYTDKNPILNAESVGYKWFNVENIKKLLNSDPKYFGFAFHFVAKNFYASLFSHQ